MFDNIRNDDRALSSVIGVVLLVALTVILVAVVGGFVTDFGSGVEAAPNAQIGVDFDTNNNRVNISHNGGADINPSTLEVEYEEDGSTYTDTFDNAVDSPPEGLIQAGDDYSVDVTSLDGGATDVNSGDTARIIWTGEEGSNREVLLEEIVP